MGWLGEVDGMTRYVLRYRGPGRAPVGEVAHIERSLRVVDRHPSHPPAAPGLTLPPHELRHERARNGASRSHFALTAATGQVRGRSGA